MLAVFAAVCLVMNRTRLGARRHLGGTSLLGGKGRVWGTLIGVMSLGIILNGMTLMNVSEHRRHIVRGAPMVAAVLLNARIERLR